jgi:hypothetical protein
VGLSSTVNKGAKRQLHGTTNFGIFRNMADSKVMDVFRDIKQCSPCDPLCAVGENLVMRAGGWCDAVFV